MIHPISIAARRPEHAAVLAELSGGRFLPLPAFPGSYIALTNDSHRTTIEVYSLGTELKPGLDCVENRVLSELLTPEMAQAYRSAMSPWQSADFLRHNLGAD